MGAWSSLKLYAAMVRFALRHNRDFAREHAEFFRDMERRLGGLGVELPGRRVLDLGCGKSYWLSLLLHNRGARVTGVDTEPPLPGRGLGKYAAIGRRHGWERSARTLAWDLLFNRSYYRALAKEWGNTLSHAGLDLRPLDGKTLDFPDDSFDLVVSHEVLEHIPDVAGALAEVARVLKPSGLTYLYVHNYASVSGGHHLAWKYPDTEPSFKVPPWDHLRENMFPDIPSWINRWRERDYRTAFSRHFEVLHWIPLGWEGEYLLTPEVRAELAPYSRRELLTKGFAVIATPGS
jgi:SAM-dependent methyltransferase